MMYEYYVDAIDGNVSIDDNIVEDEECGENEMTKWQKELIALVKINPPLWDKRQREYCGKNFKKDLAWASVASALKDVSANISDIDAEKEFYKIRQKYGKERRKVIISMKGKSGQSAQPIYIPKWELYDLCDSFLRPVIIPRKTSSNYIKTVSKLKPNEITYCTPTQFKLVVPENVKASVGYCDNVVTKTSSAKKIPIDFCRSSSNDTAESVTSESPEMFLHSQKQQKQAQVQPHLQSQSPCSFEITSSPPRKDVNTVQQILQKMTKTTANMQVPPPDSFNKKKRKCNDDELTQVYIKQSEEFNNLAQQVSQTLAAKSTIQSTHAITDPIITVIQMALTKIKDTDKFQCLLDVMQLINEKYIKSDK